MGEIWTYWRGDWHEGDLRILSGTSHGAWLGGLVFDGARRFEGVVPDLDRHSARVNASATALLLAPTMNHAAIEALSRDGVRKLSAGTDAYIKPMYWAEASDPGVLPPDAETTEFALSIEALPMKEPTGFTLTTTRFRRPTLEVMPVDAKCAALYANNARMVREAQTKGFHNALVLDANGNVAEFATANAFMVRGGEVFTPVPNGTFLDGITRQRVIRLLREAGVPVQETTLTLDDFRHAEEMFSTGNMSKVVPCIRFDDRTLPYGPVTRRARALYWEWAHS
jgi:branched-chain amino acid aminotransferase